MSYLLGLFGYGRKDPTTPPTIENIFDEEGRSQQSPVGIVAQDILQQQAGQGIVLPSFQSTLSSAPVEESDLLQSGPFPSNKRRITEVSDTKKEINSEQDSKVQKMHTTALQEQVARVQGVSVALSSAVEEQEIVRPNEGAPVIFEQIKYDFLFKFSSFCFKILTSFTTISWFAYKNDFIKDKEIIENAVRASTKKEELLLAFQSAKQKFSPYTKQVTNGSIEELLSLIEEKSRSLE